MTRADVQTLTFLCSQKNIVARDAEEVKNPLKVLGSHLAGIKLIAVIGWLAYAKHPLNCDFLNPFAFANVSQGFQLASSLLLN